MKVSPDLVPHTQFHTGVWLQSLERPGWYYFKKQHTDNAIHNKQFIESVDEPLRELVKLLHAKGIKTTPSCSGHHVRNRDLDLFYKDLEKDGREIKGLGLALKNIESGETLVYKDKNYQLPWKENDFLKKLSVYQQKGILGIRTGHKRTLKKQLLALKIPKVKFIEKDGIVFICTNEKTDTGIVIRWKEITKQVKSLLDNLSSKKLS